MKRVIGITGTTASGKDTVAEYISAKLGYPILQISSTIKEVAIAEGIPLIRANLIELGRRLSKEHGMDYLSKVLLDKVESKGIIAGMRKVPQIEYLKENSHLTLIAVDASPKLRFERLQARKGKVGETETLEQFIREETEENNQGFQDVFTCMKMADHTILNEGSMDELYGSIDGILEKEGLLV